MLQIKSLTIDVLKSLMVVFLSALLAVIGYAGINWIKLDQTETALIMLAFFVLWTLCVVFAAAIFQILIKLYREARR